MASAQARSLFDVEPDKAAEARLNAEAAYAAGRVVQHTNVAEWLGNT